jgi:carbonic anhydrase/acetyltransferase-like protein (isoleucine patch superfamily)
MDWHSTDSKGETNQLRRRFFLELSEGEQNRIDRAVFVGREAELHGFCPMGDRVNDRRWLKSG